MTRQETIGLVGVGLLGGAIARRLLHGGYRVVAHDVDSVKQKALAAMGGRSADSLKAMTDEADAIILSLPDSQVSSTVVQQLLDELERPSLIVDTTTADPDDTQALGGEVERRGHGFVDATVLGSSEQAAAGEVVVMVGGRNELVARCRPLLETFARQIFHVGPIGQGAKMKLAVNLVLGLNRAVLAEGFHFARAMHLDDGQFLEILKSGGAYSRVMDTKGEKMLSREFSPAARLSQHLKDVRLILRQAELAARELPLSQRHEELLVRAEALGYGDQDNSAIIEAFHVDPPDDP